jgi:hypothetical protein
LSKNLTGFTRSANRGIATAFLTIFLQAAAISGTATIAAAG